jgi:hypothetical protein
VPCCASFCSGVDLRRTSRRAKVLKSTTCNRQNANFDRSASYEPQGRELESLRARHGFLALGSMHVALLQRTRRGCPSAVARARCGPVPECSNIQLLLASWGPPFGGVTIPAEFEHRHTRKERAFRLGASIGVVPISCNADGVSSLLHNLPRIFVIPERNELGVPKFVGPGPLSEIDSHNYLRFHPNTALHFLGGQTLTPSPFGGLR